MLLRRGETKERTNCERNYYFVGHTGPSEDGTGESPVVRPPARVGRRHRCDDIMQSGGALLFGRQQKDVGIGYFSRRPDDDMDVADVVRLR